jgi:hypothetical protein
MSSRPRVLSDGGLPDEDFTRRGFLSATGVAGAAAALALPERTASSELTQQQRGMILAVARLAAVFPVAAGGNAASLSAGHGSKSAAVRRAFTQFPVKYPNLVCSATAPRGSRLVTAQRQLDGAQLTLAMAGTDRLLADTGSRLVDSVARYASTTRAQMEAVATLAFAALRGQRPSDCAGQARTWVGVLSRMHQAGTLADIATLRGLH